MIRITLALCLLVAAPAAASARHAASGMVPATIALCDISDAACASPLASYQFDSISASACARTVQFIRGGRRGTIRAICR